MKNLLTTQQLREKYEPDSILKSVDEIFEINFDKLISSLTHDDSPLNKYGQDQQISFLDSASINSDDLANKVASFLKDTIYFMTLSKKERTKVTQKMRAYYSEVVKNQLHRIDQLIADQELGTLKHTTDPSPVHKGMVQVFQILIMVRNNLEIENSLDSVKVNEDYTPKLFSEDDNHKIEEEDPQNEKLFGQHLSDDEEFEIPAFLRKQKF